MKKYFEIDIYIHQKCSIYFIVITSSIFLLIASLMPDSSGLNTYQTIEARFGNYYYSYDCMKQKVGNNAFVYWAYNKEAAINKGYYEGSCN